MSRTTVVPVKVIINTHELDLLHRYKIDIMLCKKLTFIINTEMRLGFYLVVANEKFNDRLDSSIYGTIHDY